MKILVAVPVRNRAWVLPETFERFKNLHVPSHVHLDFYFLVNNSNDESEEMIKEYGFNYDVMNLENPTCSEVRGHYSHNHLSIIRNKLLSYASEHQYDFVITSDSDILLPSETIVKLLEGYSLLKQKYITDKIVVSPLVRNYEYDSFPAHNVAKKDENGKFKSLTKFPHDHHFEVDLLGAVTFIPKSLFHCKYGDHPFGEDAVFCSDVVMNGGHLFIDPTIRTVHVMKKGLYVKAGLPEWR